MKINTDLPPKSLLNFFKRIETILGRKISKDPLFPEYSDRPIDIDIIFWEKGVYEDEEIIIPHPLAHKRKFILIPLTEIEENLIHPIFSKSILELLEEIDDDTWVIKLKNL
jgi:2-amino-4-hydroxy-6-hydroxymethyldihydropteridine diphosphokinase